MKTFLLSIISLLAISHLHSQTTWERTFSKTDHDFKDYSITKAADGSNDLLLAGTLWDKGIDQYYAHIIRINDSDATVVFEEKYDLGGNTWVMSIAPFQVTSGTGYAITGFSESGGTRRTLIFTIDESGNLQNSLELDQGTAISGMGLHIKATPAAPGDGFIVVGMVHDDLGINSLTQVQKQGFCVKLDQGLSIVWEKYLDVSLGSIYPSDYDVASFVIPTDQGYFITGGKNILTMFGQQRQGILAVMLDNSGNELWDASYYTGNAIDNGASAYYEQSSQTVYVLTNISVKHHLGISVFDANTGVLDNSASFEAFSSNFDLDKYGHTLIKAPFSDKLLIQGRGNDFQWADDDGRWQPAFLVDYDLTTQQFGVHYSETNVSAAFNNTTFGVPFNNNPLRYFYYPQSLVNIDGQHSAMVSYFGDTGADLSLIVRQFSHMSVDEYDFCSERSSFLLDDQQAVVGEAGDPFIYTASPSIESMPALNISSENTSEDTLCFQLIEGNSVCEGNLVQNGDFEQGTPTSSDEDITNATNWGGIWSNAGTGFSSGDFYSNLTGVPSALQAPLPVSQGQFAGFWSRIQGGDQYREGILNQLSTTIMPNTGVYELTFKIACLFTPANSPASLSVFVANGSINGGAALVSGTVPANTALFANSWEIAVHPITVNCNNNFQTISFLMDSGDAAFPTSGVNALFFTRTDGVMPGAFVAIDDVCLRKACCQDEEAFADAVMQGFDINKVGNTVTIDNALLASCAELVIDWGDGQTTQVMASDLSVSHTYSSGGNHNISILVIEIADDGSICFERDYSTIVSSVHEIDIEQEVSIYPNPARQRTYIHWETPGLIARGVLRSSNGAVVRQIEFSAAATHMELDLGLLPKGIYIFQLHTNNGEMINRKLLKQ